VTTAWDTVKGIFQGALDWVTNTWSTITDALVSPVTSAWDRIKSALGDVAAWFRDHLITPIKNAWNTVADLWNNGPGSFTFTIPGFEIPSFVPGVGGKGWGGYTFDAPNIPRIATGGIITGPFSQEAPAVLHGQEMVLNPQQQRRLFALANGDGGGGLVIQNAYFGADMQTAVRELDWSVRYRMRTVA
jgi:hypothetical protein